MSRRNTRTYSKAEKIYSLAQLFISEKYETPIFCAKLLFVNNITPKKQCQTLNDYFYDTYILLHNFIYPLPFIYLFYVKNVSRQRGENFFHS